MKNRKFIKKLAKNISFYSAVIFISVIASFPLIWAFFTSVRPREEIFATPVKLLPSSVNFELYKTVLTNNNYAFLRNILNSVVVSGITVFVAIAIGSLFAYAIARKNFFGKNFLKYSILFMTMFPQIAILGSLFIVLRKLSLFNSWWGLVFSYMTFTLPFCSWVLINYFKSIPREIEESAMIDGASSIKIFFKIIMPLAIPGVATAGILAFIMAWNEFLFALTFTINNNARTIPVAISFFSGTTHHEVPWPEIMAASVLVTIPLLLLVAFFYKKIVSGITQGAVKE